MLRSKIKERLGENIMHPHIGERINSSAIKILEQVSKAKFSKVRSLCDVPLSKLRKKKLLLRCLQQEYESKVIHLIIRL